MIRDLSIYNSWLVLPGLMIFLVLSLFYFRGVLKKFYLVSILSSAKNRDYLLPGIGHKTLFLRVFFFVTALLLAFFAALKIEYGEKNVIIQQNCRTVLFALDISRSMLASDIFASSNFFSRLDFAKLKIQELLKSLKADRVGLLLFAEKAYLQCPFTRDSKNMFLNQIDALSVSSSARTSFVEAFQESLEVFKKAKSNSNILIMITDGEDFSKENLEFVTKAKDAKIAFFALGVGSEQGAPVPIIDAYGKVQGHEKDSSGKVVLTKLDFDNLKKLSEKLGGEATLATFANSDVDKIVAYVEKFEKEALDTTPINFKNQTYHYFAASAALCLLLEQLVGVI